MYLQIGNTRILQETTAAEYTKEKGQTNVLEQQKQSQKESKTLEADNIEKKGITSQERENALDFALKSTQNPEYSLVGADSDLASLDIAKAISDMQKDSILREYQYFVKSEM